MAKSGFYGATAVLLVVLQWAPDSVCSGWRERKQIGFRIIMVFRIFIPFNSTVPFADTCGLINRMILFLLTDKEMLFSLRSAKY